MTAFEAVNGINAMAVLAERERMTLFLIGSTLREILAGLRALASLTPARADDQNSPPREIVAPPPACSPTLRPAAMITPLAERSRRAVLS